MKSEYRAGSLYVLVHPSDPRLHKVGVTVLDPSSGWRSTILSSTRPRAGSYKKRASNGSSRPSSKSPTCIGPNEHFGASSHASISRFAEESKSS